MNFVTHFSWRLYIASVICSVLLNNFREKMPKQNSYTVKYKLEAIKWYRDNGKSIRKTAGYFKVDRKRIREWINKEGELRAHSHGSDAKKRRINCGGEIISRDVEEGVLEYLIDQRARGMAVSNICLKEKALEIANDMDDIDGKLANFKASDGWLSRWKKRNNVAILRGTSEAQKIPADYGEKIKEFLELIKTKRRQNDYTLYNIGNMDQTMCRFDMAPTATNSLKNERSVRIATTGGSKRGFTVALCGLATGDKKPAYICFKERNATIPPRVFANLRIPDNVMVTVSLNGWMTRDKMQHWVNRVWGQNVDDVRRLIILDRARIHTMPATVEELSQRDTDVVFVPGGCTPIAQPADVAWNLPFKTALRKEWKAWREQDIRTPQNNFKMATRQDVINWVSKAWRAVKEETVKKSFKYCGISNKLDGTEDALLSDNMMDAIYEAGRLEDLQDEAAQLLFMSDSDTDSEFSGFSESDLTDD